MKPGWKTTEFWLTALSGAPALLVAAGLIPISDQQTVSAYISKIVSGLIATVALAKYIHGRALVKSTLPALLLALLLPLILRSTRSSPNGSPTAPPAR